MGRGDRRDPAANQVDHQRGQQLGFIVRPPVVHDDVLALDIAGLLEPLAKCPQIVRLIVGRLAVEEPDHRHRRLLCTRGERPRSRRAAEQSDKIPVASYALLKPWAASYHIG